VLASLCLEAVKKLSVSGGSVASFNSAGATGLVVPRVCNSE
jgi:hypothetical protein